MAAKSLKAQLKGRPLPSVPHRVLLDAEALPAAQTALDEAGRALRRATIKKEPKAIAAAEAAMAQAKEAVAACFADFVIRAIPPADYEALISAHPPTKEQLAENPETPWNPDTFEPALVAACVDSDMDADDWAEFLASGASLGEGGQLVSTTIAVNVQVRIPESTVVPKGLEQTLSSHWR